MYVEAKGIKTTVQMLLNLNEAIEGLYQAFAIYPLPRYTNPCLHCHTLEDEVKLHRAPLKELGVEELRDYMMEALLVWGGVNDFKHFLPRIFELYFMVDDPDVVFWDPEMVFSKLRYGQWLLWPEHERAAVKVFLHAVWAAVVSDPPSTDSVVDVQSWLCSIAQAEDDLSPYLFQWIQDQRVSASFALSSMILSDAGPNAFWNGRKDQYEQLQRWLKSKPVIEKLQQASEKSETITARDEFEAALACI